MASLGCTAIAPIAIKITAAIPEGNHCAGRFNDGHAKQSAPITMDSLKNEAAPNPGARLPWTYHAEPANSPNRRQRKRSEFSVFSFQFSVRCGANSRRQIRRQTMTRGCVRAINAGYSRRQSKSGSAIDRDCNFGCSSNAQANS
jgi:hypothetical protein